jgi:hypothetical protein
VIRVENNAGILDAEQWVTNLLYAKKYKWAAVFKCILGLSTMLYFTTLKLYR